MKNTVYLLICLFIFFSYHADAQKEIWAGILPGITVSKSLNDSWRIHFRAENRQKFFHNSPSDPSRFDYEYLLTDLSVSVSKKTGLSNSLFTGYLIRFTGDKTIHRFTQQFNLVNSISSIKLAQRFAVEEFFSKHETPRIRIRYRVVSEFPLQGRKTDPGEFYLKVGSEFLWAYQSEKTSNELRISPSAGLLVTQNHRLEAGVDYRTPSLFDKLNQNYFWLTLNWFIMIP